MLYLYIAGLIIGFFLIMCTAMPFSPRDNYQVTEEYAEFKSNRQDTH